MHRHAVGTAALLLAASSLTAACSAQQPKPTAKPSASASVATADSCAGAVYHFTPTARTTVLAFLSPPHTVATGGAALPEDMVPVGKVVSSASSSSGTADADRAYAVFVRQLGGTDTPAVDTAVPPAQDQVVSPSAPGTYALYRAADVFTAQFSRTCGPSPAITAYGTVTTWDLPRDGDIQCGTTTSIPPHAALARTLACGGQSPKPSR
ncbi:hypothetical protein ABH931_003800 [Streptacidiphilus sp. MAP12-33]|uniref:hypothetical protein n=1 Tax=Streptacidiphilus sp. MAP12-33 TaxID=3156266 RepID=UPI0035172F35